jgi:hypothetical protein
MEYTIQNKFHKNQSDFQSFIQETFVTKDNIHKWTVEKCSNAKNQNCISIWAEESWDDALHWAYGDEDATEIHNGAVILQRCTLSQDFLLLRRDWLLVEFDWRLFWK